MVPGSCMIEKLFQPWHPRSLLRSSTPYSDWTFDFSTLMFWVWERSYIRCIYCRSMLATVGSRFLESWTSLLSCRIFGLFGTECSDIKFLASKWSIVDVCFCWETCWNLACSLISHIQLCHEFQQIWFVSLGSRYVCSIFNHVPFGCTWLHLKHHLHMGNPLNIQVRWPAYAKSWLNGEYRWSRLPRWWRAEQGWSPTLALFNQALLL